MMTIVTQPKKVPFSAIPVNAIFTPHNTPTAPWIKLTNTDAKQFPAGLIVAYPPDDLVIERDALLTVYVG